MNHTTKIPSIDYLALPTEEVEKSQIDYLKSMYDLWEEKSQGHWHPLHDDGSDIPESISNVMTSPLKLLKDLTCSWWLLPKWVTNLLGNLTKGKKTWTINLYKDDKDYYWYLDIPWLLTYKEILTGGTEETLDYWYEKLSGKKHSPTSKMKCTVSSEYIPGGSTTILTKIDDLSNYDDSTTYKDTLSGIICWLCPYLKWLYHGKPESLYVKLTPLT